MPLWHQPFAFYVGISGDLPKSFTLLGLDFITSQQRINFGWAILSVATYVNLHFIARGCVEIGDWLYPKIKSDELATVKVDITKLTDVALDSIIPEILRRFEKSERDRKIRKRLSPFYRFVWLRMFIEVVVPVIIFLVGFGVAISTLRADHTHLDPVDSQGYSEIF